MANARKMMAIYFTERTKDDKEINMGGGLLHGNNG